MLIKLIVNADDYGRTQGVSSGIRSAHLQGIVTSTTAMLNMPGIEEELEEAQIDCPSLGLGVHLVLTAGKPLLPASQVSSLLSGNDHFPTSLGFLDRLPKIDPDQVRSEWNAQIYKFIRLTGTKPDHLDSHHHTSYFTPVLFQIMLELASDFKCAIRPPLAEGGTDLPLDLPSELGKQAMDFIPALLKSFNPRRPDNFYSSFYDQSATTENLFEILSKLSNGTSEIMCHPGFADPGLMDGSSYNLQREAELKVLKDPTIKSYIQDHNIQLIKFANL
ncbi:MAG: hypothetical protein A2X25_13990 [Chloroflexi bacterium GWB2_49_20]|nr:MAG: hypothetical protein A2X25_13990 [Chloroflexi bacterium GWB2_49_20]OGN79916.1 MAG: hypothetical protein A2X26_02760 [Chloroflexi bacterium GWC2_49_37]OGN85549.1 MAG: hypothetical protein A2X27_04300 [Chloroflexi bacterium GWD2_49_16]HBG74425.1 hypothetical protein [Anaerolineae bacterium]HCC79608.1 hypothetical protein [Anaerolineae bacterium]